MMGTVATIVRLRWALTIAAMRKSVGQTVGYVIGLVMALGVVVGVGVMSWLVGLVAEPSEAFTGPFNAMTVVAGSFLVVSVVMVQVMYLGQGSTLSPNKFALYGIPDRTLSLGLLVAGLTGVPAVAGTLGLLLWSLAYRGFGVAAVVAQIVAAPLAVLVMMSLSKLTIAAATTLVRSRRGKNMFYIVVVLAFVILCQLPGIVSRDTFGGDVAADGSGIAAQFAALSAAARVFAWTPFGAAFQLPFDVLSGAWGPFAARLIILAVTVVLCFMGTTACLRRERLVAGSSTGTATVNGLGAFGRTADSPSGAIAARLLTYMRRDARQSVLFVMPVLIVALMALQSRGTGLTEMIWGGLIMDGWFMFIGEANGLAYDGRGYAMEVISGVRGIDDRLGRVRLLAGYATVYLLVLAALILAFTGEWRDAGMLRGDLMFIGLALGCAYASLGLAEVTSVVLLYPVPSIDKPFSSPQGRAVAQGFFPLVQMLGTPLLLLPAGLVALVMALAGAFGSAWAVPTVGLVALVNGAGALALGTWLGGKLLEARSLSVLKTLNAFASLQK